MNTRTINLFALTVLAVIGLPNLANAALICKGSGYGLTSTYTIHSARHGNLSVKIKTIMLNNNEVLENDTSTAIYTSTVSDKLFGTLESYYYIVHGKHSYTELIAISHDKKSMARARPQPSSGSSNFQEFTCRGSM